MYLSKRYQAIFEKSKLPILATEVDIKTVPAPVSGWNDLSPLSNMDPLYAPILDNWVPRPGYIEVRGGYTRWTQGISDSPVETLMVYRPAASDEVLFAVSNGEIWDCSAGAVATIEYSGLLDNRLQYTNFTPGNASTSLLAVNGTDPYLRFDGSSWTTPTITGVNSRSLVDITVFKRRIWFIEKNSTRAWFLDTDAIQGPATAFDIGDLITKGSYLKCFGSWTIDGGNGPDDYFVLMTNKGQVVIYRGIDPANNALWVLVGVFDMAQPLGSRPMCKLGSDLLIITLEGLVPISKSLPFDPSATRALALTNTIQNTMRASAAAGRTLFGWECQVFDQQSLLIMNVPITENVEQHQYVMNTITGSWTRFTGWNANTFEIFNESLYFGDNEGNVCLAYAGALDLVEPISYDMQCAFNYLDAVGRVKTATLIRPFLYADGTLTPDIGIDVDFGNNSEAAPVQVLQTFGGIWDESVWGPSASALQGIWSVGAQQFNNWQSVEAIGTALAIRMKITLAGIGSDSIIAVYLNSVFDVGLFDTAVFDGGATYSRSGLGIPILRVNAFQLVTQYGNPV